MSSSSSEIDNPASPVAVAGPSRGRKRVRNPEAHKRAIAKAARNKGEAYVSTSNKAVAKRVIGTPCKDGCFGKVTQPGVQSIFSSFWSIGDYNMQNAYIQKQVVLMDVQRSRLVDDAKKRSHSRAYHVTYNGVNTKVCMPGFMAMHAITKRRIDSALRKVSSTAVPESDKRGRHEPVNKIVGEKAACVREHIKLLPAMSSHYSRAKAPNRLYLESTLTIKKLHDLYLTWMAGAHPNVERVTFHYYSDVFTREFNISFEPPKIDTCTTCDTLDIAKANATTEAEKVEIKVKKDAHLAEKTYAQNYMRDLAKDDDDETRAICMDLQQILPTPKLHTGIAYYKRKMWTYNFCIHDLKKQESTMFVWHEAVAKRGSVEVVSCLKTWIDMEYAKGDFTKLIVVSDNCAGQNKNINLVLYYLRELHQARLFEITHFYLIPGHSYMACDRAFGNIERKVTSLGVIYTPEDYVDAIMTATVQGFTVIKMTQDNFLDFAVLQQYIVKRKARGSQFRDCRQLLFRLDYRQGYKLKPDYSPGDTENVTLVRLQKGKAAWSKQKFDLSAPPLPLKYTKPLALNPSKLRDIEYLLTLMPSSKHEFYRAIIDAQRAGLADDGTGTQDDPDEPDELNEMLDYVE